MQEAAEPWQKDFDDTPKTKTHRRTSSPGAILPIWDRFGDSLMKVKRAQTTTAPADWRPYRGDARSTILNVSRREGGEQLDA